MTDPAGTRADRPTVELPFQEILVDGFTDLRGVAVDDDGFLWLANQSQAPGQLLRVNPDTGNVEEIAIINEVFITSKVNDADVIYRSNGMRSRGSIFGNEVEYPYAVVDHRAAGATGSDEVACRGLAVRPDVAELVYFADLENNTVRRVPKTGTIDTNYGNSSYAFPANGLAGMVFDEAGNLFVTDTKLWKTDLSEVRTEVVTTPPLNNPEGIDFALGEGSIVCAERGAQRVVTVDPDNGTVRELAQFASPVDVAVGTRDGTGFVAVVRPSDVTLVPTVSVSIVDDLTSDGVDGVTNESSPATIVIDYATAEPGLRVRGRVGLWSEGLFLNWPECLVVPSDPIFDEAIETGGGSAILDWYGSADNNPSSPLLNAGVYALTAEVYPDGAPSIVLAQDTALISVGHTAEIEFLPDARTELEDVNANIDADFVVANAIDRFNEIFRVQNKAHIRAVERGVVPVRGPSTIVQVSRTGQTGGAGLAPVDFPNCSSDDDLMAADGFGVFVEGALENFSAQTLANMTNEELGNVMGNIIAHEYGHTIGLMCGALGWPERNQSGTVRLQGQTIPVHPDFQHNLNQNDDFLLMNTSFDPPGPSLTNSMRFDSSARIYLWGADVWKRFSNAQQRHPDIDVLQINDTVLGE